MDTQKKSRQFMLGVKAGIPVILGFVPVGIAYALMARNAGLSVAETCSMSVFVFAGASQMMAAGMVGSGAGIFAIVLATFIINLRHLIMSTCVMNHMQGGKLPARLAAAFGVTDESFSIFTMENKNNNIRFFFGLMISTYLSWVLGSFIGAIASDFLPEIVTLSLGVSLYAMFIGLLFPSIPGNGRLALLVLMTAVTNTILNQFIASSWALVISTLLCAFIGCFFVDTDKEKEEQPNE